ncbi:hypothetical protein PROFUN_03563 [Planoprotostelium fungivorum]|uniref:THH1/TOM1/TOM3 domain-containing protein n=1 Tax=Planoprotostelium fungivorum TaxID=1890364 RepID=A0A2P6MSF8_9EUKA|nr:hypothetical protein PROFUN_03563 [Planoprotostelium fungivorum]
MSFYKQVTAVVRRLLELDIKPQGDQGRLGCLVSYQLPTKKTVNELIHFCTHWRVKNMQEQCKKYRAQASVHESSEKSMVDVDSIRGQERWSGKLFFSIVVVFFLLVRSIFFFSIPKYTDYGMDVEFMILWEHFGSFLLLTTFIMLLIYWRQFYRQLRYDILRGSLFNYRAFVLAWTLVLSASFIILFVTVAALPGFRDHHQLIDSVLGLISSSITIIVAFGFLTLSILFYRLLGRIRPLTEEEWYHLRRTISVGLLCCILYTARAGFILYSSCVHWTGNGRHLKGYWIVLLIFLMEVVPIVTTMVLLRTIPSWRVLG